MYYLDWSSEAHYLAAEVEYQLEVDKIGFFPWYECPHPGGWQPLQWLIHQSPSDEVIPKWQERFREHGDRVPDIIDAYLTDEFIRSLIAAIDILTRVLSSERRQSNESDTAEVDRLDLKKQPTKKIKTRAFRSGTQLDDGLWTIAGGGGRNHSE